MKQKQRDAQIIKNQYKEHKSRIEEQFEKILNDIEVVYKPKKAFLRNDNFQIVDFWLRRPYSIAINISGKEDKDQTHYLLNSYKHQISFTPEDILVHPEWVKKKLVSFMAVVYEINKDRFKMDRIYLNSKASFIKDQK